MSTHGIKLSRRRMDMLLPLIEAKKDAQSEIDKLLLMVDEMPDAAQNVTIDVDQGRLLWDSPESDS